MEWNYGVYEGKRTTDIHEGRPGWDIWRDGCPHGETPADISDRADKLLAHLRELSGNVALFSHGQFGSALAARWIGLAVIEAQHFALGPASISILAHEAGHPKVPVIALKECPRRSIAAPLVGSLFGCGLAVWCCDRKRTPNAACDGIQMRHDFAL